MLGTRGIWHEGWFANTVHAATPGGLVALRQGPLGAVPHRGRPQPVPRPGGRASRQARGTQGAVVRRGREVQRASAGGSEHPRDHDTVAALPGRRPQELHLLPGHRRSRHRGGGGDPRPVVLGAGRGRPSTPPAREGVLFKQGGGARRARAVHPGRPAALHLQLPRRGGAGAVVAGGVPLGKHTSRRRGTTRTGTVEGSHTPLGDVSLYIDGAEVASRSGVRTHPGTFGLAGASVAVGRNTGSPVSGHTGRRTRSPVARSLR